MFLFYNQFNGTEWPIMRWCAVKKLLTHSHSAQGFTMAVVTDQNWRISVQNSYIQSTAGHTVLEGMWDTAFNYYLM